MRLSRESELLLCCARTRVDEPHAGRIRALLEGAVDWTRLVEQALWHQVTPLLAQALRECAADAVPEDIAHALEVQVERQIARSREMTAELLGIIDTLAAEGIDAVPFKGPALACTVYGGLEWRTFRDVDFLVREQQAARAIRLLEDRGYRGQYALTPAQERGYRRYSGQKQMAGAGARVVVEPHWAFAQRMIAVELDYAALWSRTETVAIGGRLVKSFSAEDTWLILCIHGAKEQWTRLKWVCDVAEFLRRYPDLDWERVCGRAREQGCLRMALLGAALANELLEAPLPGTLRSRIAADGALPRLVSEVRSYVTGACVDTPDIWKLSGFRLRMRERARDKLRYAVRTLLTPRAEHYQMVALPDALFLGYYPVRWLHDYVALPLWLLLKFGARRLGLRRLRVDC